MAEVEVCTLEWHVAPFRADRWLDVWEEAAAKMPAYGAKSWSLTRSKDDPLAFQRYWFSEEIEAARTAVIGYYDIPILPTWHTLVAAE